METMDTIFGRISIRSYEDKEIEYKLLEELCFAGMSAPSARNTRPWEFIIIQEKETLQTLSKMREYWKMLKGAGAAIVIAGKKDRYFEQNCAAATENVLLAATDKGIGSVWLGLYPNMEEVEEIAKLLSLPSEIVPFSVVSLGYPKLSNTRRNRELTPEKIHSEHYKKK